MENCTCKRWKQDIDTWVPEQIWYTKLRTKHTQLGIFTGILSGWFHGVFSAQTTCYRNGRWIRKDLEGSGYGLIEVLSRNCIGGTKATHERKYLSQESKSPSRDSYQAPPEYKSIALPLNQSAPYWVKWCKKKPSAHKCLIVYTECF
jgi:hypothetical protein